MFHKSFINDCIFPSSIHSNIQRSERKPANQPIINI